MRIALVVPSVALPASPRTGSAGTLAPLRAAAERRRLIGRLEKAVGSLPT